MMPWDLLAILTMLRARFATLGCSPRARRSDART